MEYWFVTVVISVLNVTLTFLWSLFADRPRQYGVLGKRSITLKSSDMKLFHVSVGIANQMKVVQEMVEEGDFFPLPNVTSKVLTKVVEYCEQHATEPENESKSSEELENWDRKFASDQDIKLQFELLMAANYLEVESLQELMSKSVAKSLEGRSVEDVREIFNIENDYTPEEEEALRWEFERDFS